MEDDFLDIENLHYVDVGGIRTRYYEDGEGPTVVLWSGGQFGGVPNSLDHWSLNLRELAHTFHVVAFDKLGQGYTDNPKERRDYTFDRLLEHSLAAMDAVGIAHAHIVGHSRGALLACWIAHERPDLIESLVICDTASVAVNEPNASDVALWESLGLMRGTDPGEMPTRESVAIEPRGQAHIQDWVTEEFVSRLLAISELPKVIESKGIILEIDEDIWRPSLEFGQQRNIELIRANGFHVPTLVVWGVNDLTAPLSHGFELFQIIAERTAGAEMHIVNHAGHYVFRDQPVVFNRVLCNFCAR